MQAMWASLRENVNCRSKLHDVIGRQQNCRSKLRGVADRQHKCNGERTYTASGKENSDTTELPQMGNPVRELFSRPNYPRTQFYKKNIGDPSRNIIETIFLKALMDPSRPSRKIIRVLKVKNSVEILERFEKYRETVKQKAYEQYTRHPRSAVDGNELLRFYGTVMTCGERLTQVSDLCKDPLCRVCRTLQSNFDTNLNKNGIRLSTSSEELCDNMVALTRVKNMVRAVIVCRTIAGRVANKVDRAVEDCDSFKSRGLFPNLENLVVTNPCAVLPCFVIVFT